MAGQLPRACRSFRRWGLQSLLDLVFPHLPGEGVPVHSQRFCSAGERAVATAQNAGDEALLELVDGILELDALVHHFFDQSVEAFGNHARSRPVRRRYASRYFSRVLMITSSGRVGTGGCLFHLIASR